MPVHMNSYLALTNFGPACETPVNMFSFVNLHGKAHPFRSGFVMKSFKKSKWRWLQAKSDFFKHRGNERPESI